MQAVGLETGKRSTENRLDGRNQRHSDVRIGHDKRLGWSKHRGLTVTELPSPPTTTRSSTFLFEYKPIVEPETS